MAVLPVTLHTKRRKPARGSTKNGHKPQLLCRITVALTPADMAILSWWAGIKAKPVAWALREAVECYVKPFKDNPALKAQYGSQPKAK